MDNPPTDIICLVHNQLQVTQKFVEHLFSNTKKFNLIFVDNGSKTPTYDYLRKGEIEGKWKLIRSESNLGVIGGRNLGAQHISAPFFLNIDNDQYVKPGWLEMLHNKMNEGYDIVGCEAWKLTPPGKGKGGVVVMGGISVPDRTYFPHKRCVFPQDKFSYIGCGGMLIKKEVYDEIGLFDEQFNPAYYEDPDFCWRADIAGFKMAWCPQCPIIHLSHQTIGTQSSFSKGEQFVQSWKRFRKKWGEYFPKYAR